MASQQVPILLPGATVDGGVTPKQLSNAVAPKANRSGDTFTGVVAITNDINATAPNQLTVQGLSNTNQQLSLGYNTTNNYGSIQANLSGTGTKPLALNPSGGVVVVNKTTSSAGGITALDITGGILSLSGTANQVTLTTQCDSSTDPPNQFLIQGNTATNKQLKLGYQTTADYGSVQAIAAGVPKPLALNPSGGSVMINKSGSAGNQKNTSNAVETYGYNLIQVDDSMSNAITDTSLGGLKIQGQTTLPVLQMGPDTTNTATYIKSGRKDTGAAIPIFVNPAGGTNSTVVIGKNSLISSSSAFEVAGPAVFSHSTTNATAFTIQGDFTTVGGQANTFAISDKATGNKKLNLGYNTGDDVGEIQALTSGVGAKVLSLNPGGGGVVIGGVAANGTHQLTLGTAGAFTGAYNPASASWDTASDNRIKQNIVAIDSSEALDTINQLSIKDYEYTEDYSKSYNTKKRKYRGMIADEVIKVCPNAVSTIQTLQFTTPCPDCIDRHTCTLHGGPDFTDSKSDEDRQTIQTKWETDIEINKQSRTTILEDFKTFNPSDIQFTAIAAIQECAKRIKLLEERLNQTTTTTAATSIHTTTNTTAPAAV